MSLGIKHVGNTTDLINHLIEVHKINLEEQSDHEKKNGNKVKNKKNMRKLSSGFCTVHMLLISESLL